ncbi:MAG: aminopeptidase P family protein [Ichthyobacteriaceae bacterium]|nr:aminopeptidase P family protein [Ichthyobacteriaceae bacterium]
MKVNEKISALRLQMEKANIDAYIIPSTDSHISEYVADFWSSRQWISGFTGSAGTVVVTKNSAGLWTDGRYFLQAEEQLSGSEMILHKQGMADVASIENWLIQNLDKKSNVGVDASVYSVSEYNTLQSALNTSGLNVVGNFDLISPIWNNRPQMPVSSAYILDVKYAGEKVSNKIKRVKESLASKKIDSTLLATLDDIAWVFNLRGSDVDYNPVAVAYAYISIDKTVLFIDKNKLSALDVELYKNEGVSIEEYNKLEEYINTNVKNESFLIDFERMNQKVYDFVNANNKVINLINPSTIFKSIKNTVEISNIKNAMVKDGVAMVEFLHWIDTNIGKEKITEIDISDKLYELRSQQEGFVGESFSTIAGYKQHGAIIHYFATPETNIELNANSFVLVDSGAQYYDGTTDLTRTIPLGKLTEEEKRDYTLVLKGHIQLALAKFPVGTKGYQLDTLARQPLLREGLNYHHGTGHGVGFFLNVHEGPQGIRPDTNNNPLLVGSVTSNEPGLYRSGKHGIRIENLVVTNNWKTTEFGEFLEFETVTICPIDTRPVMKNLLTQEEVNWLNDYNNFTLNKLGDKLNEELKSWLTKAVLSI